VVESQGEPRKRYLAVEIDRESLGRAIENQGGLSADNKISFLDGKLVQIS
jgi:hypothetical protein